jgi:hypothetical protein
MGRTMSPFLSEPARAALARLVVSDTAAEVPDPLSRLYDIRSLLAELEAEPATLHAVRDALADGETWDEVAAAAQLKPAAAKWRWQGTDEEIAARHEAGRKRAARPSSAPTDLPGDSVADVARKLGVTAQAVYLQISRGKLTARTVELPDGRSYKRVFLGESPAKPGESPAPATD